MVEKYSNSNICKANSLNEEKQQYMNQVTYDEKEQNLF